MNREPKEKGDRFMKTKRLKETPQEIEELGEQIEEWRRTREKQTAMPEELWQATQGWIEFSDGHNL
jgi:hypothetical protein